MSDTWLTIAEAATLLKVHPRTIERRIASGKIQTRRTDVGLLQVFVDLPQPPDSMPDTALATVRELAADQLTLATGTASALVKFAQDDSVRARQELITARRWSLAGWCLVAALTIGVCVAVGWTASRITRAGADARQLSDEARRLEAESADLRRQLDSARHDARQAQIARAEASGKLAGFVEQMEKSRRNPSTRPATVVGRLMWAFSNY